MKYWDDVFLRGKDPMGSGAFAASRSGRRHNGVDYRKDPGDEIVSPVSGIVTRIGQCYSDTAKYKLVEILTNRGFFMWRFLYVDPTVVAGDKVKEGDVIGHCQDIASKYGGGMINHCHVEVNIDPSVLIGGKNGEA